MGVGGVDRVGGRLGRMGIGESCWCGGADWPPLGLRLSCLGLGVRFPVRVPVSGLWRAFLSGRAVVVGALASRLPAGLVARRPLALGLKVDKQTCIDSVDIGPFCSQHIFGRDSAGPTLLCRHKSFVPLLLLLLGAQ